MKFYILCSLILNCAFSFAQDKTTISYREWQDLPQDTYVRIMTTADSLLKEYHYQAFNVEMQDGNCCLKGLLMIKELYNRALIEQPEDEDAKNKITEIDNLIKDEELLQEEKHFEKVLERGDYYFNRGYYEKALRFYKRAQELSPSSREIKKKIKKSKKLKKKYSKT